MLEQLSILLASGMNMVSAMHSVKSEMKSKSMILIIEDIIDELQNGANLSDVLDKNRLFSANVVALIRIGEESGKLTENLNVVVEQQQKNDVFSSKVRSAMMYPIFILVLTLVVGLGVSWFILPRLSVVFSQLDIELPLITRLLIQAGDYLGDNGTIVIPIFLLTVFLGFYIIFFFSKTRCIGQFIIFHFPGAKKVIQEIILARMGYYLGTLLDAGLPMVSALDSLEKSTDFYMYRRFFAFLKKNIEDGYTFDQCFKMYKKTNKVLPISNQQMIITGEKSSKLTYMFLKIAETYENKLETTTKNLSVILEPLLLVIVWLGVLAVAIAIILPIYGLVGGFDPEKAMAPVKEIEQLK